MPGGLFWGAASVVVIHGAAARLALSAPASREDRRCSTDVMQNGALQASRVLVNQPLLIERRGGGEEGEEGRRKWMQNETTETLTAQTQAGGPPAGGPPAGATSKDQAAADGPRHYTGRIAGASDCREAQQNQNSVGQTWQQKAMGVASSSVGPACFAAANGVCMRARSPRVAQNHDGKSTFRVVRCGRAGSGPVLSQDYLPTAFPPEPRDTLSSGSRAKEKQLCYRVLIPLPPGVKESLLDLCALEVVLRQACCIQSCVLLNLSSWEVKSSAAMPPGIARRLPGLAVLLLAVGWPLTSLPSSVAQGTDSSPSGLYPTFIRNDTLFEHLALHPDPSVSRVYVGARDRLFQLDRFLQPELEAKTGPVTDSRECLPPVTESNCPQARLTSNHNKLLLVDPYSMELITCGSVNQGICQKRNLNSVDDVRFSTERPVDTQYVAANHPNVSTVGLVVRSHPDRQPVLFVGRGYTSSHPPISTRNLAKTPIFSYEETAKLAVAGRLSEYDHHFVASFAHRQHVYFLFYRRDLKSQSREYRTYVSRVCLDDQAYYSYVEVPLTCRSGAGKIYNLLQAVQLGLTKDGTASQGSEVLLGVFSTLHPSTRPSEDSALCMFDLKDVDSRINSTRDLCYTQMGREAGLEAAYIEYEVKSNCANLPEITLDAYPCGSDHTPSPMASRMPVEAETILDSPSARLTAVAVSVRPGHTIAFLGDSKGNLHKVFLGPNGEVEEYSVLSIQQNTAISSDLILDQKEEHLFIMTQNMLQKRPVAECQQHPDCHSCLLAHDPYCGWCVLEGRLEQPSLNPAFEKVVLEFNFFSRTFCCLHFLLFPVLTTL
ncbi:Plexin-B1 [Liparis tanakae]|uniref:Plexin-B1 n=1 Tax=Liparis tanakae TaxID=230148 RepID=A0A4Z2IR45_9TELE|nr:Plexin-B1 [Liparis tanakae]